MLTAHAEYTIVYSKGVFLVIYFQITVSSLQMKNRKEILETNIRASP